MFMLLAFASAEEQSDLIQRHKELWMEVLLRAIEDIKKKPVNTTGYAAYRSAVEWVDDFGLGTEEALDRVNSFSSICQLLGVDPTKTRAKILAQKAIFKRKHLETSDRPTRRAFSNPYRYAYSESERRREKTKCSICGRVVLAMERAAVRYSGRTARRRYVCSGCVSEFKIIVSGEKRGVKNENNDRKKKCGRNPIENPMAFRKEKPTRIDRGGSCLGGRREDND